MSDIYIVEIRNVESFLAADDPDELLLVFLIVNLALRLPGNNR